MVAVVTQFATPSSASSFAAHMFNGVPHLFDASLSSEKRSAT
jgi:hypothetical protein